MRMYLCDIPRVTPNGSLAEARAMVAIYETARIKTQIINNVFT